jgi:hypothetical protein
MVANRRETHYFTFGQLPRPVKALNFSRLARHHIAAFGNQSGFH